MKCPVCYSDRIKVGSRKSRDGFDIEINECKHCGHYFQPEHNYEEIYTTGAFTIEARQGKTTPGSAKIKELDKRALQRISYYREFIDEMDNVLEIGSSIGSFVHVLKLKGKTAAGLEPDADYAGYSEIQYGFTQLQGLLEDFNFDKKYHAICCFHTLEHVLDPHQFLKKCADILMDRGKLLFEFPSLELHMYGSMTQTIWKPHIHYFTRASLYLLFSKYFKVHSIGYLGSALYVFAQKADGPTTEQLVFKKHRRKAKQISNLVRWFPEIPLKIPGISAKQLVMQSVFFQKNRSQLIKRYLKLGIFSIRNKLYLNSEKGAGNKKVIHFSYYSGWENAGDTVLSKCVRDNFNALQSIAWSLEKVTNPVTEQLVTNINSKHYMVIGGGGLLLPDSNPNSISGWQWAISEQQLDQIKVPIIVYGIGYNFFIGQQPGPLFIESLKKFIERASFFSLRNGGSIKAVESLVGETLSSKIHFQPCPTTVIRRVDKSAPPKHKTRNIGINIAYDRYPLRYGADIYVILDQVALALKDISNKGYQIFNICHLENDAKFELTLDAHDVPYKSINLQYSLPKETYQTYCNMELVMGTRGHAQMIPFGLNTKIISLGSHNKLRFFLEDIDALDWLINLKKDPSTLRERITTLFFDMIESNQVPQRLLQQQENLFQVTRSNYQIIRNFIN
jgi:SAM-dependent methyltransferase